MTAWTKKFIYRRPRYRTDLPVMVRDAQKRACYGRCTEISTEGLGITMQEEFAAGDSVTVDFKLKDRPMRTAARVEYRSEDNYYGLSFQFPSEGDRALLRQLLESMYKVM